MASIIGYHDGIAFGQASSQNPTTVISATNATTSNISSINTAVNKLNFTSATGTVASIQNDASGRPTWIVSGQWHMLILKPKLEESKSKLATIAFNTTFYMVGTAQMEQHYIRIQYHLSLT